MRGIDALLWGARDSVRTMQYGEGRREASQLRLRRVALTVAVAAVLVGGCRDDGGNDGTTPESVLEVGATGPGTCLDFPLDQEAEIKKLPVVENCNDPHSHEIYAVVVYGPEGGGENDVFPGFDALETFARAACLDDFDGYFGISAFDSELFYSWIVPTLDSWDDKQKDREILCVAGNQNGAPLVGTQAGVGR